MDFKLVDTVRLQKFKDKLLNIINTNVTTINNSISSEATARDAAISKAIATEVSNRNTELAKKIRHWAYTQQCYNKCVWLYECN